MRVFCILLPLAAASWCQVAQEANRDYQTPEQRAKMVERLESPARLANLRPAELISRLKIPPGSTVVDLGTGTGTLLEESDTPREAGGLMSWAASKAVGQESRRRAKARLC